MKKKKLPLPSTENCAHLYTVIHSFSALLKSRQCGTMISTGFNRWMSCGPHSITGEIRVLSGASGISCNNGVSSKNTPKKTDWLFPAGIAPLGTTMQTSDSKGALSTPPVLVNVSSNFVMYFGTDVGRWLCKVSLVKFGESSKFSILSIWEDKMATFCHKLRIVNTSFILK